MLCSSIVWWNQACSLLSARNSSRSLPLPYWNLRRPLPYSSYTPDLTEELVLEKLTGWLSRSAIFRSGFSTVSPACIGALFEFIREPNASWRFLQWYQTEVPLRFACSSWTIPSECWWHHSLGLYQSHTVAVSLNGSQTVLHSLT